jgi:hypothetical protein
MCSPCAFDKNDAGGCAMHSSAIVGSLNGKVTFYVQLMAHDYFGVFADGVLISIHFDKAAADAHCQRLRDQQAAE